MALRSPRQSHSRVRLLIDRGLARRRRIPLDQSEVGLRWAVIALALCYQRRAARCDYCSQVLAVGG